MPSEDIADALPFEIREDSRNFLLVHRFDRDAGTPSGRLHVEDMAQVLGTMPLDKYKGSYASIGFVLKEQSSLAEKDVYVLCQLANFWDVAEPVLASVVRE